MDTSYPEVSAAESSISEIDVRTCILVLGMHRSGTSALTRALSFCGHTLPKSLLRADVGNTAGHWESKTLMDFNNRLLNALGLDWYDWREADFNVLSRKEFKTFSAELLDHIHAEFGDATQFILKDPRNCRLASFYIETLSQAGISPRVVLPFRHPIDVLDSLNRRDGTALEPGNVQWLRHILDAELASRGAPRIFMEFSELLNSPLPLIKQVHEQLRLPNMINDGALQKQLDSFLDKGLTQSNVGKIKASSNSQISEWEARVYGALQRLTTDAADPAALQELDTINSALTQAAELIAPHYTALEKRHQDTQVALQSETDHSERRAEHILHLEEQQQRQGEHVANLENERSRLSEHIVSLDIGTAQSEAHAAHLTEKVTTLEASIEASNQKNTESNEQISGLNEQMLGLTKQTVELSEQKNALEAHLTDTQARLSEKGIEISRLSESAAETSRARQDMASAHSFLQDEIVRIRHDAEIAKAGVLSQVHASTSWRVTRPLRAIKAIPRKLREMRDRRVLKSSNLFDPAYYLTTYPDVATSGMPPEKHYLLAGGSEGRNPSPDFNSSLYFELNRDVSRSNANPLVHFERFGRSEKRAWQEAAFAEAQQPIASTEISGAIPCALIPLSDISRKDGAEDDEWDMTGNDPAFTLDLSDTKLPANTYCLSWDTDNLRSFVEPRLYYETDLGYHELSAIALTATPIGKGKARATFTLPEHSIGLRFDPSTQPGTLSLSNMRIEPSIGIKGLLSGIQTVTGGRFHPLKIANLAWRCLKSFARGGPEALKTDINRTLQIANAVDPYSRWIASYDTLSSDDIRKIRGRIEAMEVKPLISVVAPVYNPPIDLLDQAIKSVQNQLYPHWELCLANDNSTDPEVREFLDNCAAQDSRIKVVHRGENGHISKATNSALDLVAGEWIALLDNDDLIPTHALYHVAEAINANPDGRLFYSDEDKIDLNNRRHDPYFKSDWNRDLFFSQNMISHLGVYQSEIIKKIGGFRTGVEGSQDYDLALRFMREISEDQIVHIPHVLYHWRVMPGSTAMSTDEKPYALLAGERALNEFYVAEGIDASAKLFAYGYRTTYTLPDTPPKVSVVIPTRNAKSLVQQCIDSILERTDYPNYEIILVDNGSDDAESIAYFETLSQNEKITVIRDDGPFNYSALNNNAVKSCDGSVIALLNNDIEVISENWLTEMVSVALQPNVGAVGAMLYYPNERIQHGGVVMGIGGVAGHANVNLPRGQNGYFSRAALSQEVSAVTAACMVVTRENFESIGGLNETELKVAFNDVDFCLRLRKNGKRNVWTPFAELYHHESATRGYEDSPEKKQRLQKEVDYMNEHWGDLIHNDPYYSPNLSQDIANFTPGFPPRVKNPWQAS